VALQEKAHAMKKYGAILADPPWTFATYSAAGKGRSAEAHYNCMSHTDICLLLAGERWAAPDCVLFLWTTNSLLCKALQVIDAWGFTYKTIAFTWAKRTPKDGGWHFGLGYWTRQNTEHCLLATKGKPHRIACDVPELIVSPRREHSRKPEETYDRIERLCEGPYLELFARQRRYGWDSLGDEVDSGIGKRRWASSSGPPDEPQSDDLSSYL